MCDIRTCPHPCHGDKGGRYLIEIPLKKVVNVIYNPFNALQFNLNENFIIDSTDQQIDFINKPTPNSNDLLTTPVESEENQNKAKKKIPASIVNIFRRVDGIQNIDPVNYDSQLNTSNYNNETLIEEETTTKNIIARPSKYHGLNEGTTINEKGFVVSNDKKKLNQAGKF